MRAVGIDLGTSNSALAHLDLDEKPHRLRVLPVAQLVAQGEVGRRPTLPSLLYLPSEHELPEATIRLPWASERTVVGELARAQGAAVPGRLITSAKSWLCHPAVDRQAAILPWAAPAEVERRSPIDASAAYLAHLAAAYQNDTGQKLADAELVLTVPASFDEVARELTVEAAKRAGIARLTLLEEPQAAFYSWLADHGEREQTQLRGGETVLVCDIGGGTTDFTLITVEKSASGLIFHRTAVGDHLLLGGDNMDLALARRVEKKLAPGSKLDAARFQALLGACRVAKEKLLGTDEKDTWTLHLAGRGRGLVGGALQSELTRAEVEETVLDGFFPLTPADVQPLVRATGLREFGLPYAHDARVTAHLAAFLRRHSAKPDAVLWNGGVLTAPGIRARLLAALEAWHGQRPAVLENDVPDLAVARGAAYYTLVRRGEGVRIAAGAARAYYVEIETPDTPAGKITALCLAARGEEEGATIEVPREFELLTNRPVRFRLLSSSERSDAVGSLLALSPSELAELPPIVTVLRFPRSSQDVAVSVRIEARRTELGTLDLQLHSPQSGDRWKLAFDLRAAERPPEPEAPSAATDEEHPVGDAQLAAAVEVIRAVFDKAHPKPIAPATAMKELAATLGADKAAWPTVALRRLWEPLKDLRGQRGRTAEHEARWLNLVGYCLRPGYGVALDDWRVKEAWRLFNAGLVNDKDNRARLEWWILWRRISGGLTRTMQDELGKRIFPHFLPDKKSKASDRKSVGAQEAAEMWRVVGSLERIHREEKFRLGEALWARLEKEPAGPWVLGRLGARVPLYGPIENVVTRHKAEKWVERLLALDWTAPSGRELAFATAEIARASGDRGRDLDDQLRQKVAARLAGVDDGKRLAQIVLEPNALEARDERAAFGDALPAGLRLTSTEGRASEDSA